MNQKRDKKIKIGIDIECWKDEFGNWRYTSDDLGILNGFCDRAYRRDRKLIRKINTVILQEEKMKEDMRVGKELFKERELGEKMKEETKKLSIDEVEHKINALAGLFGITDKHRLRWYLAGLIDGYKGQVTAGEKAVKLKGIDFFTSRVKGCTIRAGDALVLMGELKDGRPTTQVIPWDAIIEVKTEPCCPVVTCSTKKGPFSYSSSVAPTSGVGEKMKIEQIEKLPSWEEQRKALKDAIMRRDKPIECNCIPYKKWKIEKDRKITVSTVYPAKPEYFHEYTVILVFNEKLETWQAEPLVECKNVCPVCLKLMLVRAIAGTTWLACCSKECYEKYKKLRKK